MIGQFAADMIRGIATAIVKACLLSSNGKLLDLRRQRIALSRQLGSSMDMLTSIEYCYMYDSDRYEILIVALLRVQLILRFVFEGLSSVVGKADELIRGHESKHGGFSVLHGFLREVYQVFSSAEISEMSAQSDIFKLIDQICKLYKNTIRKIIPYDHYMSRLGFPTSMKGKDVVLKWIYNINNTDDQLFTDILSLKINNIDLSHYNSYRISMLLSRYQTEKLNLKKNTFYPMNKITFSVCKGIMLMTDTICKPYATHTSPLFKNPYTDNIPPESLTQLPHLHGCVILGHLLDRYIIVKQSAQTLHASARLSHTDLQASRSLADTVALDIDTGYSSVDRVACRGDVIAVHACRVDNRGVGVGEVFKVKDGVFRKMMEREIDFVNDSKETCMDGERTRRLKYLNFPYHCKETDSSWTLTPDFVVMCQSL